MRPFLIGEACLRCHAQQGYHEATSGRDQRLGADGAILAIESAGARTSIAHDWFGCWCRGSQLWGRGLEAQPPTRAGEATPDTMPPSWKPRFSDAPRDHAVSPPQGRWSAPTLRRGRSMTRPDRGDMRPGQTPVSPPPRWAFRLCARTCLRSARSNGEQVSWRAFVLTRPDRQEMIRIIFVRCLCRWAVRRRSSHV